MADIEVGGINMNEEQRQTMGTYNGSSAFYSKKYKESFEKFGSADAERFVSELKGNKVLDSGCGPGIFLEFFRENNLDAMGIDLSDGFLQICSSKGLNVRKMDMETPVLYPHSFDGIFSNMSLLHIPRERVPALIDTLARLLKTDGLLYISVKEGDKQGMEADEENPPHLRWMTHFTDDEIKSFVSKKFDVIWEERMIMPSGKARLKYLFRLKPASKPLFQNH